MKKPGRSTRSPPASTVAPFVLAASHVAQHVLELALVDHRAEIVLVAGADALGVRALQQQLA